MRKIAFLLTSFHTGVILFVLVKPGLFLDFLETSTWPWLFGEEAIKVAFGVTLIGAASTSRMPTFLRIVGGMLAVGGIIVPILGADFVRTFIDGLIGQNVGVLSAMMVPKLMFMGVVGYGLMPPRDDDVVLQGITQ